MTILNDLTDEYIQKNVTFSKIDIKKQVAFFLFWKVPILEMCFLSSNNIIIEACVHKLQLPRNILLKD